MERIEYQLKKQSLEEAIKALKIEIKQLQEEYIDHHRIYPENTKVEIITRAHPYWSHNSGKEPTGIRPEKRRHAFVVGYEIDWNHNVVPKLKKCRKDGTISLLSDCFNSRLESLSQAIE